MTRLECARGMRVSTASLLLTLVTVLGASFLLACDASTKPPRRVEPTTSVSTLPEPSNGGAVRVKEVGFTTERDSRLYVLYGAVLENVSSRIAAEVTVTVQILGASGDPLEFADLHLMARPDTKYERTVYGIGPGEKLGLGGDPYLLPELGNHKVSEVAAVSVEVSKTIWWQEGKPYPDTRPGVSDIEFKRKDSAAEYNFTTNSACDHELFVSDVDMQVVFYDGTGKVVGGALLNLSLGLRIPPGKSKQRNVSHMPEKVDVERVEIYAAGTCEKQVHS